MANSNSSVHKTKQYKELLESGKSGNEIAAELGVTKGAVSQMKKRMMNKGILPVEQPTIKHQHVDDIKIRDQFKKINKLVLRHLSLIEDQISERKQKGKVADKETLNLEAAYRVLIQLTTESRKQIEMYFNFAAKFQEREEILRFQEAVMEEIGAASKEVRESIIKRLKSRRSLQRSITAM